MKSLVNFINESVWNAENNVGDDNEGYVKIIKDKVFKFIEDNYEYDDKKFEFSASFDKKKNKYIIDFTGTLNVRGSARSLTNDLFEWGKVGVDFICDENYHLTSIEGSPKEVGNDFKWWFSKIKSLKGAPEKVGRKFVCDMCDKIESLEGITQDVKYIEIKACAGLTSLKGAPKEISGSFSCTQCPNLTNLKGAPKEVKGQFDCSYCEKLTSLEGAPEYVGGNFYCKNCRNLKSLKGIGHVENYIKY